MLDQESPAYYPKDQLVTPIFTYDGVACNGTPKDFLISVNPSLDIVPPVVNFELLSKVKKYPMKKQAPYKKP